jgi:lysophospholipid acyltransferase (LPLAT)-like uncharacterized protein
MASGTGAACAPCALTEPKAARNTAMLRKAKTREARSRLRCAGNEKTGILELRTIRLYYTPMATAAKTGTEPGEEVSLSDSGTQLQPLPFSRRLQVPILGGAAISLVRLVCPTLRYDICGLQQIERTHAGGRRCIFAFWHRGLIPLAWWARRQKIAILSGTNFDAQWAAYVTLGLGLRRVLGSSSRGGLRGIVALARSTEEGYDAAFTADGPRGPCYVAKPGPVLLARRTGCPIVCVHAYCDRARTLEKAWDRFQIPYPFSRIALLFAPPIEVPAGADSETIRRRHAEMQSALEGVRDAAESWFAFPPAERERERALWNS